MTAQPGTEVNVKDKQRNTPGKYLHFHLHAVFDVLCLVHLALKAQVDRNPENVIDSLKTAINRFACAQLLLEMGDKDSEKQVEVLSKNSDKQSIYLLTLMHHGSASTNLQTAKDEFKQVSCNLLLS